MTDRPDSSGEAERETCVWCMADRQSFIGCCGRERAHHHTMTKWRGDVVRIIPSDDCPEPPIPPRRHDTGQP